MAGRTLSSAAQTEVVKPDNALGFLVEIAFDTFTGRYCTYGDVTWNSLLFRGVPMQVGGLATDGAAVKLRFFDADASMRTLCLTKPGVRNRPIKVWKFYVNALGASDPIQVFNGVGDEFQWAQGRVDITGARAAARFLQAPRKRLGPATGCNFLAAPGTLIPWGNSVLLLEPSRG
jgi:hypothetical protein